MHFPTALSIFLTCHISMVFARPSTGALDGLPACAQGCAFNGLSETGSDFKCAMTDFKCICSNESFLSGIQSCVVEACSREDQERTLTMSKKLCEAMGVKFTATLPAPTGTATGTAAAAAATSTGTGEALENAAVKDIPALGVFGVVGVAGLAGILLL